MNPPTGTLTFLLTDIEGVAQLWERHPEGMRVALARHDALLHQIIEQHNGHVLKTVGDEICGVFAFAPDALAAALAARMALLAEPWEGISSLRVRMALHIGGVEEREGNYFGPPLNWVARLLAAGHGGQVVMSQAIYELVRDLLPPGATVKILRGQ